ncbi:MAG: hypothetical protein ACKVHP_08355 [Verrucomicrobiales bacterium]|jgi:hypothetical protein
MSGIASASDFASKPNQVGFGLFFGSYVSDFDNFLHSFLAVPNYGLTSCWSARPHWNVYRMGLGETMGDVMRSVYNEGSSSFYNAGLLSCGIQASLLGDPTLRLHPLAPAQDLQVQMVEQGSALNWAPSAATDLLGYHVYRAHDWDGAFVRLTSEPIAVLSFTDPTVTENIALYMVRAVALQRTPSRSYYNASQRGVRRDR